MDGSLKTMLDDKLECELDVDDRLADDDRLNDGVSDKLKEVPIGKKSDVLVDKLDEELDEAVDNEDVLDTAKLGDDVACKTASEAELGFQFLKLRPAQTTRASRVFLALATTCASSASDFA